MKTRFVWMAFALALGLIPLGCGGSTVQPDMPDPSVLDQTADDLELPEVREESEPEAAAASETASDAAPAADTNAETAETSEAPAAE